MAAARRTPLFLARRSYRRRRLMDAARMLPLVALALWLLPVLWTAPGPGAATRVVYLFAVWFGLILCAAVLAGPLRRAAETEEAGPDRPPGMAGHAPPGPRPPQGARDRDD